MASGGRPKFYPIEHGFDEMKEFAAYYPGVYTYDDTSWYAHPWFPKFNKDYWEEYQKICNQDEWEGKAGQPAMRVARIDHENLADFDVRQTNSAVEYIKAHANSGKPFFMDVNFMGCTSRPFRTRRSWVSRTSATIPIAMIEMDSNIGRIMDAIRAEAPDTIVIHTADNGAWQDAWPDAGTCRSAAKKERGFEGAFRVPGIMWARAEFRQAVLDEMMSHMDVWPTTATMAGLTPPPHGEWKDNNGKPIYFDGIDNTAYVTGKANIRRAEDGSIPTARSFYGACDDVGDKNNRDINIAWKLLYSRKTPGSVPSWTSVPSVLLTTSRWIRLRSTT